MPVYQRIKDLCDFEGSQRKFADKIKKSSANISSIIKNRTGVQSDTIVSILKVYPRLRPEWLLLDEGQMWLDGTNKGLKNATEVNESMEGYADAQIERINKLLENRVNELEREIKRDNPGLAEELGIE